MDALHPFAARRGVDVDLTLERIVGVSQLELAFAAAEERLEDVLEALLDRAEGLEEERSRGAVDLLDGLEEGLPGGDQVITLRREEAEPLGLLGMLLDGERIHRPNALQGFADPYRLA